MTDNPSDDTGEACNEKLSTGKPQEPNEGGHQSPFDSHGRFATENQALRERVTDLEATLSDVQAELTALKDETNTKDTGDAMPGTPDSAEETGELLTSGGQPTKVIGRLSDTDGIGVLGEATGGGPASRGVLGLTQSSDAGGTGVRGEATASSGATYGVYGATASSAGYGIATPDDAQIQGTIDTDETDFTVDAGTTTTIDARNVILGHAMNEVVDGATGGTVSGGGLDSGTTARRNRVTDDYGTVGGGLENQAGDGDGDPQSTRYATVGGGESNQAMGDWATVGGGENNTAIGTRTTVAGGGRNDITGTGSNSAIVGGVNNAIQDTSDAFVGGGLNNTITSGAGGVIGGGWNNSLDQSFGTIGGGRNNEASGSYATVGGGGSDDSTLGNTASGDSATVPGGRGNTASGNFSFATGRNATANHDGAMVFGDSSSTQATSQSADETRFQGDVAAERSRSIGELGMGVNFAETTVSPNTKTKLEFGLVRFETKGQVDTNTHTYTIDEDGVYLLTLSVGWRGMAAGDYYEVSVEDLTSGITELSRGHEHADYRDTVDATKISELSGGAELEVSAEHDGSADRDVRSRNDLTYFQVIHLG